MASTILGGNYHAQPVIPDEIIPDKDNTYEYVDGWNAYRAEMLKTQSVLPKQPEPSRQHFETLCNQFWNWVEFDEINQDEEQRLEWNGSNSTHRVTAALWKMYQAAPTQPVMPGRLTQRMAVEKAFLLGAVLYDEEADIFADGWNAYHAEMLKNDKFASTELPNHSNLSTNSPVIPDGWKLVPIEPTEEMIVEGFESRPDESFSKPEVWEEYAAMSGCKQAAHRAKLCWAAMLAAAPAQEQSND